MQFYNHRNDERWRYNYDEMLWFLPPQGICPEVTLVASV